MCGIVGYIGDQQVAPLLIQGLKRLEYRGYDSAGIAVAKNGSLLVRKEAGKIAELEKLIIASGTYDHAARVRSYEIAAQVRDQLAAAESVSTAA